MMEEARGQPIMAARRCFHSSVPLIDDIIHRSAMKEEIENQLAYSEGTATPDVVEAEGSSPPSSAVRNPLARVQRKFRLIWSQLTLSEISGSLGDLGTLIPLLVALARQGSVLLEPALFWGGFANVVTGLAWDLPMCIQPMKAIAALALAEGLTQSQVTAAGMWMGIFMTVIGFTNIIEFINIIIPSMVVAGLQMGVGMNLAILGINMVAKLTWVGEADSILLALLVSLVCMFLLRENNAGRNHPLGIYLFLLGLVIAIIKLVKSDEISSIKLGGPQIAVWTLSAITGKDWLVGLTSGALPQLPLTTLNSVISVCALAKTLYPSTAPSRREVAVSVGLMNLILCPIGSLPYCHGAGGLAGQHRFGARHGASVVFLGVNKMILAVLFGATILSLLDALPDSILGVMLAIAGQELATTGVSLLAKEQEKLRQQTVVAMVTTVVMVALRKTEIGVLAGWFAYMIYADGLLDFLSWLRRHRRGTDQNRQDVVTDTGRLLSDAEEKDKQEHKV